MLDDLLSRHLIPLLPIETTVATDNDRVHVGLEQLGVMTMAQWTRTCGTGECMCVECEDV